MKQSLHFRDHEAIWLKVHDYLQEKILNGEIAPNTRLVESAIAKEIGTSRTPVREALHNMQQEGLVQSIPRVGYIVKELTEDEMVQICGIRTVLEILAAEWAVQRDRKAVIRELRENISSSKELIRTGNLSAFIDLDEQFHGTLSRLSGSHHLLNVALTMRRLMLRIRIKALCHSDNCKRSLDGHRLILKAIQKGDIEEIRDAIVHHVRISLEDIRKELA
ncbi:MAG: GntR family transcriptional regulator [Thermodesulfobacteriota bacterium]